MVKKNSPAKRRGPSSSRASSAPLPRAAKKAAKKAAKTTAKKTAKKTAKTTAKKASASGQPQPSETLASLRAELKAARTLIARLEKAAHEDVLLDVLNRRGFERELRRAIAFVSRYGTSAALLFADVDGLKPINDLYGHAAGDRYLLALTRELAGNVRQSDTLARIGGDEFALLLWNITERDAHIKAKGLEKIADELRVTMGTKRLRAGLSLGMTMLRPHDDSIEALKRADRAMYLRKSIRKSGQKSARQSAKGSRAAR